jgi:hypothetical protein
MTTQTPNRNDVDVRASAGDLVTLPEDVYLAEFTDFTPPEDLPPEAQSFGPAVRLTYTVVGGDYDGQTLDELASVKGGPKAKLRQRAAALRGSDYGPDESIRLVPLLGQQIKLVVKVTGDDQKGFYNKIESALPATPAPRAARPAGGAEPAAAPARPSGRKF